MAFDNSKTIGSSPINTTLEITIKDFRTASESSTDLEYMGHSDQKFAVWISASAFSNGYDEDTEGWLVVRPNVYVGGKCRPAIQNRVVSWVVSVIDIEGNTRFPRSFMQNLSEKRYGDPKYLERSFILNRADDFLPKGVLTLRCDICFEWHNLVPFTYRDNVRTMAERGLLFASSARRPPENYERDPEIGDPIDSSTTYDVKNKLFRTVCLDESGKLCDSYAVSYLSSYSQSEEKRDPRVWIFETRTDTFNVLINEELEEELGTLLMKASPVIRRCMTTPMKEQREKRIKLQNVDTHVFRNVCYFLVSDTLIKLEFDELLEVYKFSHLYEMKELRRKCSEDMIKSLEPESDFEEVQKIADFYSDEYLSELLYIRRHEIENVEVDLPHLRMDDSSYSNCYI